MACPDTFDAIRVATEYLSKDIYRLASFADPFINLIPRGIFAPNTGITHSVFTVQKQEPTNEENAGQAVVPIGASGGASPGVCSYSFTAVSMGTNEYTYTPLKLQWKGNLLCKDDQYFTHSPDTFITSYVEEMASYVQKDINNHLMYHYIRRVPIYVAGTSCMLTSTAANSTLTAPQATSELTQEMLDNLAQNLIWNRATNPDSAGYITLGQDGPLFSLLLGLEASQLLALNNSEFRQDLRWADASILMKRLGAGRVIKNFRHIPWATPARFTWDGAKYVRVATFVSGAASKGVGTSINPAWISTLTAPYEAAIVLSPYVMESELIKPKSVVGSAEWPDTNYMGDWMFKTGNDALIPGVDTAPCDPLHKMGRHFAEFMHALKPAALPASGAVLFFKRCEGACTQVTCS